jgi:hypothetical protein
MRVVVFISSIGLLPLYVQAQKMCGAGNARIIVTDHGFRMQAQCIFCIIQAEGLQGLSDVLFDTPLVLAGGWYDLRITDEALFIQAVAMP